MDELKKQAEALGIKVDGRWSEDRLREEIEKVQAQLQPDVDPAQEPEGPEEGVEPESEEPQAPAEPKHEQSGIDDIVVPMDKEAVSAVGFTITSLIENPMKALGLKGLGDTATITVGRLSDERFVAKLQRAEELGMIKVVAE